MLGTVREAASTAKPIAGTAVEDAKLEERALAAFKRMEMITDLQKEHLGEGRSGNWWDESGVSVQIFKHPSFGETLVSVEADNGGDCGDCVGGLRGQGQWARGASRRHAADQDP